MRQRAPLRASGAAARAASSRTRQHAPAPPSTLHSEVSPKEKLVGYIIKNPPEEKLSKAEKK